MANGQNMTAEEFTTSVAEAIASQLKIDASALVTRLVDSLSKGLIKEFTKKGPLLAEKSKPSETAKQTEAPKTTKKEDTKPQKIEIALPKMLETQFSKLDDISKSLNKLIDNTAPVKKEDKFPEIFKKLVDKKPADNKTVNTAESSEKSSFGVLGNTLQKILNSFKSSSQPISQTDNTASKSPNLLQSVLNNMKNPFEGSSRIVKDTLEGFKKSLKNPFEGIGNPFEGSSRIVKDTLEGFKKSLKNPFQDIKNPFEGSSRIVKDTLTAFKNSLKSPFEKVTVKDSEKPAEKSTAGVFGNSFQKFVEAFKSPSKKEEATKSEAPKSLLEAKKETQEVIISGFSEDSVDRLYEFLPDIIKKGLEDFSESFKVLSKLLEKLPKTTRGEGKGEDKGLLSSLLEGLGITAIAKKAAGGLSTAAKGAAGGLSTAAKGAAGGIAKAGSALLAAGQTSVAAAPVAATAAVVAGGDIIGGMVGRPLAEAIYGREQAQEALSQYGNIGGYNSPILGFLQATTDLGIMTFEQAAESIMGGPADKMAKERQLALLKYAQKKGYKTADEFTTALKAGKENKYRWDPNKREYTEQPEIKTPGIVSKPIETAVNEQAASQQPMSKEERKDIEDEINGFSKALDKWEQSKKDISPEERKIEDRFKKLKEIEKQVTDNQKKREELHKKVKAQYKIQQHEAFSLFKSDKSTKELSKLEEQISKIDEETKTLKDTRTKINKGEDITATPADSLLQQAPSTLQATSEDTLKSVSESELKSKTSVAPVSNYKSSVDITAANIKDMPSFDNNSLKKTAVEAEITNKKLDNLGNGFNALAKSLERLGVSVAGQTPTVINNVSGGSNGSSPKISSTQITGAGNSTISSFRSGIEASRFVPA